MPKYTTSFNPLWLENEGYKSWLQKASQPSKAFCRICLKTFDISNMGEPAVRSHKKSMRHEINLKKGTGCVSLMSMLKTPTATPAESVMIPIPVSTSERSMPPQSTNMINMPTSSVTTVSKLSSPSVRAAVTTDETLRAEILWTLKVVSSHYSYNSSANISNLFVQMFPDSNIAKKFTCGADKIAYFVSFGLGPHFKDLLKKRLGSSEDGFVMLFDETLNRELNKKQMDIHVRYWDGDHVITRYYSSAFLGHATAQHMFEKIQEQLDVDTSKIIQISMDGPNVNWSLFKLLSEDIERQVSEGFKFIDIGSCGLHTVHNAFRAGHATTNWDLSHFFSSMSWLFKDTPARREDFVTLTGCTDFPLDHCSHRWVENIPVAERALKVWPHIKKFIHHLITTKKTLHTKSFEHLKACTQDELLVAKVESFISIAKIVQPFLTKYQSDAPLLPFIANDLHLMIRSILQRFVPSTILSGCNTASSLISLDLSKSENLLEHGKIDIGFKANKIIKEASKNVSAREILNFRLQCREFLKVLAERLIEKSPIKSKLIRNLKWMQPKAILEDYTTCLNQLVITLDCLVSLKRIDANVCDTIKSQFIQWHTTVVSEHSIAFQSFETSSQRLDIFYSEHLGGKPEYFDMWKVMRSLLLLSHGQAQVERGFSVNKETMTTNMIERTLTAKRVICDYLESIQGLGNLTITASMLMAAASARSKYRAHLEELAEEEKKGKRKRKMDDEFSLLETLKRKKMRMVKDISLLTDSADKLAEKAENTNAHKFLIESNALRRSAKEKMVAVKSLTAEIESKIKEIGEL